MAKRRLSKLQKRRIKHKQKSASSHSKNIFEALVIANHGNTVIIESEDHKTLQCKLRQNLGDIVCGDNVVVQMNNDDQAVVIAINERFNFLQKSGFGDKPKAVAANISQVVIVASVEPRPNPYLIDRYLVATENLSADTLIIINKIDLINDSNNELIQTLKETYDNLGYRVILTSVKQNKGIDLFKLELANTTSILVGLSGVGKSSLVKTLLPAEDILIGDISDSSGEGKHTTTASSLYHLHDGGSLIDSPGVRDFTPIINDRETIIKGFIELNNYRGYCKFSNCTHSNEPGCAILEALSAGELSQQRVDSFRKMIEELQE